ncbi:Kinesin light chain 3 [Entophlyctis sp. JEL0112]|nr:Kinesin light chain 3 [Entophlyctis sp. JEL0112]
MLDLWPDDPANFLQTAARKAFYRDAFKSLDTLVRTSEASLAHKVTVMVDDFLDPDVHGHRRIKQGGANELLVLHTMNLALQTQRTADAFSKAKKFSSDLSTIIKIFVKVCENCMHFQEAIYLQEKLLQNLDACHGISYVRSLEARVKLQRLKSTASLWSSLSLVRPNFSGHEEDALDLADLFTKLELFSQAETVLSEVLRIFQSSRQERDVMEIHLKLGTVFMSLESFSAAKEHFEIYAKWISEELGPHNDRTISAKLKVVHAAIKGDELDDAETILKETEILAKTSGEQSLPMAKVLALTGYLVMAQSRGLTAITKVLEACRLSEKSNSDHDEVLGYAIEVSEGMQTTSASKTFWYAKFRMNERALDLKNASDEDLLNFKLTVEKYVGVIQKSALESSQSEQVKLYAEAYSVAIKHDLIAPNYSRFADVRKIGANALSGTKCEPSPQQTKWLSERMDPTTMSTRGVRFSYLLDFVEALGGRETLIGKTTDNVNVDVVLPQTAASKLSLVDYLLREGRFDVVAESNWFVSHAWRYQFVEVVDALAHFFAGRGISPMDAIIWFDMFSNSQHDTSIRSFDWWQTTFRSAIQKIGQVVMVLQPFNSPITLTRAWCVYEIYSTISTQSQFHVAMTPGEKYRFQREAIGGRHAQTFVTCRNCQASLQSDLKRIFEVVEQIEGGFYKVDNVVAQAYYKSLLDTITDQIERTSPEKHLSRGRWFQAHGTIAMSANDPTKAAASYHSAMRHYTKVLAKDSKVIRRLQEQMCNASVHIMDADSLERVIVDLRTDHQKDPVGDSLSGGMPALESLLLILKGKFNESERYLRRIIAEQGDRVTEPSTVACYYYLGFSLMLQGKMEEIVSALEPYVEELNTHSQNSSSKLMEKAPMAIMVKIILATAYVDLSPPKAIAIFEEGVAVAKRYLGDNNMMLRSILLFTTRAYMNVGDFETALKYQENLVDAQGVATSAKDFNLIESKLLLAELHCHFEHNLECKNILISCFKVICDESHGDWEQPFNKFLGDCGASQSEIDSILHFFAGLFDEIPLDIDVTRAVLLILTGALMSSSIFSSLPQPVQLIMSKRRETYLDKSKIEPLLDALAFRNPYELVPEFHVVEDQEKPSLNISPQLHQRIWSKNRDKIIGVDFGSFFVGMSWVNLGTNDPVASSVRSYLCEPQKERARSAVLVNVEDFSPADFGTKAIFRAINLRAKERAKYLLFTDLSECLATLSFSPETKLIDRLHGKAVNAMHVFTQCLRSLKQIAATNEAEKVQWVAGLGDIFYVSGLDAASNWYLESKDVQLSSSESFLVADLGAETVSVVMFETVSIDVFPASCTSCGSSWVDREFLAFLSDILGGDRLSSFRGTIDFVMLMEDWEQAKCSFSGTNESFVLAYSLWSDTFAVEVELYNKANKTHFDARSGKLIIPAAEMQKFFDPAVNTILGILKSTVAKAKKLCNSESRFLLCLGGFSRCRVLVASLRRLPIPIVLPNNPDLLAANGAVLIAANPRGCSLKRPKYRYGMRMHPESENLVFFTRIDDFVDVESRWTVTVTIDPKAGKNVDLDLYGATTRETTYANGRHTKKVGKVSVVNALAW